MAKLPSIAQRIAEGALDLHAMELDYRSGTLTNQEICRKFKISGGPLANIVREQGWTQDCKKLVREAARRQELRDAAVAAGCANPQSAAEVTNYGAKVLSKLAKKQKKTLESMLVDYETCRALVMKFLADKPKDMAAALHYLALPELKGIALQRQIHGQADENEAGELPMVHIDFGRFVQDAGKKKP